MKKKSYDVNNSMDNSYEESESQNKKSQKHKKRKEDKKEKKSQNILDDIKMEDENKKEKILEEVNNTMIEDNKKPKKKIRNEEENNNPSFIKNKKNESNKEKEKGNKKKKKVNNIIGDTFNELEKELNEECNLGKENIFEINNKFNYPRDSPAFYIREDNSNTDLYESPLSTNEISEKLRTKKLRPFLLKVKLIDIFVMKNQEPFSYFDFNDILKRNWSKNLEYSSLFLNQYENKNIEKNRNLEITSNDNAFSIFSSIPKKSKYKKVENNEEKKEEQSNNITMNLNFSAIDKKGLNDFSMSIIKQLENIPISQKKMEKIQTIIEEVEEDEWTEIKGKKKEGEEKKPFIGIVGLNESRQIIPEEPNKNSNKNNNNNKKKKGKNAKKKKFVDFNNQFAGLKINHEDDDDDDEDEK